jgi:hypothetical protein
VARRDKVFYTKENDMKFQKSADTRIIENVLSELKIGEIATYDTLSKAIGRDVRKFAQGAIATARKSLLNTKQFVFGVETNIGLRRLDDSQIVESTESDRVKMQRHANRTIKKLTCVNFEGLSEQDKKRHIVASAQMGAMALFSGKNAEKKIATKVDTKPLAIGETLKLFG